MINVDVNDNPNGTVKLWFKHEPCFLHGELRHRTVCRVLGIDVRQDDGEELLWTMAEGVVNLYPKDTFSKRIGRKEALKKALTSPMFSREVRTIIWNEYFKHCKR